MNIYLRYFDNETLVYSVEEAVEFLASLQEIDITDSLVAEINEWFQDGENNFPKRCRVRPRVYFIAIKTEAQTLQDFKEKKALRSVQENEAKNNEMMRLTEEHEGWYEGTLDFKRVVINHLGKCEYRDTTFTARCKAKSPKDCYERITNHLKQRVDSRSQFPSIKGKNFKYSYLGKCK
ncbi:MAG: hypothetical protein KBT34_00890 [Prevotella sp.]|nr:hypothetical protein [Candidatus Prevotella equi]